MTRLAYAVTLFAWLLVFSSNAQQLERVENLDPSRSPSLRGRRQLLDDGKSSWRDKVKEKGETVFQEKKRAAIRAACYKDWKPGCRRIVEWAKKTGRVKGAEQQELVEFARKVLEQAEKNGDIFKPGGEGSRSSRENTDDSPPENENAPQALASSDLQLELVEPEEN
mmetsp:Transcript_37384/g.74043  ORF Transcript_37384/g.74043 Transcript_37384/m.74043 type:complete len:167 (+) Transcript_37384:98-598(+)